MSLHSLKLNPFFRFVFVVKYTRSKKKLNNYSNKTFISLYNVSITVLEMFLSG